MGRLLFTWQSGSFPCSGEAQLGRRLCYGTIADVQCLPAKVIMWMWNLVYVHYRGVAC